MDDVFFFSVFYHASVFVETSNILSILLLTFLNCHLVLLLNSIISVNSGVCVALLGVPDGCSFLNNAAFELPY